MRTKTTNSRKRKRTRTGSSLLLAAATALALLTDPGWGKNKDKDKPSSAPAPSAVIAGTVFRPPGFALPGAKIRLAPEVDESAGTRLKASEALTDARGEFAFRVSAVPAKWLLRVEHNGYQPQTRAVSIEGEQRFDLTFQLEPAAGNAKGDIR